MEKIEITHRPDIKMQLLHIVKQCRQLSNLKRNKQTDFKQTNVMCSV